MGEWLKTLTLKGFKSIESLESFDLRSLNILIGANGAGKSNLVDFFRFLRAIVDQGLALHVQQQGGADRFLFLGPKQTPKMHAHLEFGENVYEIDLAPTATNSFVFIDERVKFTGGHGLGTFRTLGSGMSESQLLPHKDEPATYGRGRGVPSYVLDAVSNWTVYHFHDTSMLSPMRRDQLARDGEELRSDASNIAAFLLNLREKYKAHYESIRDTVRLIAPFFQDFLLRSELAGSEERVRLEWLQKGSTYPFQPTQLSDGTIRFICLATALSQPRPPSTVVIDEPELGLHPYALTLLSELIRTCSKRTQVLISTQSPTLLDHFEAEDVVVVDRENDRSIFRRLEAEPLSEWLSEYSVGELWQKNVVQGGPHA